MGQSTSQTKTKPETILVGSANAAVEADRFWAVEEAIHVYSNCAVLGHLLDLATYNIPDKTHTVITPIEGEDQTHVELYDSGVTHHILPYKSGFTTYSPLPTPVLLNIANKQQFPALGTGTMVIQVPNENELSTLTLQNVLYVPSVSYTLISLGALDQMGYQATIGGGHLDLITPEGICIGRILQLSHRLYCVLHLPD